MGKTWVQHALRKLFVLFVGIGLYFGISKSAVILADLFSKGSFKYTWYTYHHLIQAVICLIVIYGLRLIGVGHDFGLNTKNTRQTGRTLLGFTWFFVISTSVAYLVIQWSAGWQNYLDFSLTSDHVFRYLFFEGVVVGIGEELLFRALIYTILFYAFPETIRLNQRIRISYAVVLSALIFMLAHINLSIFTFDIFQLFMAFGLGCFYGWFLENTKSIIGPILAHNISDLWISILMIVFTILAI